VIQMCEKYEFDGRTATKNLPQIDWEQAFERATGSTEAPMASQALQRFVSNVENLPLPSAQFVVQNAWYDGELLRVAVDITETWFEYYYMLPPEPSQQGHEEMFIPALIFWSGIGSDGRWLNPDPTGPHEPVDRFELLGRLCDGPGSHLPDEVSHRVVDHIELLGPFHETEDGIELAQPYANIQALVGFASRCLRAARQGHRGDPDALATKIRKAVHIYHQEQK
jgi:hypothetical protein